MSLSSTTALRFLPPARTSLVAIIIVILFLNIPPDRRPLPPPSRLSVCLHPLSVCLYMSAVWLSGWLVECGLQQPVPVATGRTHLVDAHLPDHHQQ